MSLYRKYRPEKFSDLIGQEHISKAITNAILTDKVAHAYLFSGPRGTGKTTSARIMARSLNCENLDSAGEPCLACESCLSVTSGRSMAVVELDAASNNGVDEIKQLIDSVYYQGSGKKKVYIIDEVHELTSRAANALLKTLEEPPEGVIFILATTNPEKVLPTIKSRTQHFMFNLVSDGELKSHLIKILSKEEISLDDELIDLVVAKARGSVRDALTSLDQMLAQKNSGVDQKILEKSNSLTNLVNELFSSILSNNFETAINQISIMWNSGCDPREVCEQSILLSRNLVFAKSGVTEYKMYLDEFSIINEIPLSSLMSISQEFAMALSNMRGIDSMSPSLCVEIAVINLCNKDNVVEQVQQVIPKRSTQVKVPSVKQEVSKPSSRVSSSFAELRKAAKNKTAQKVEEVIPEVIENKNYMELTQENLLNIWPKILEKLPMASKATLKHAIPSKIENGVVVFVISTKYFKATTVQLKRAADEIRLGLKDEFGTVLKFKVEEDKTEIIDEEPKSQENSYEEDLKNYEESTLEPPIDVAYNASSIEEIAEHFGGKIIEVES